MLNVSCIAAISILQWLVGVIQTIFVANQAGSSTCDDRGFPAKLVDPERIRIQTRDMAPSADKDAFRRILASSKNIIILSGAGLSAASG